MISIQPLLDAYQVSKIKSSLFCPSSTLIACRENHTRKTVMNRTIKYWTKTRILAGNVNGLVNGCLALFAGWFWLTIVFYPLK